MKKISLIIAIAAIALPLSVFTIPANAGDAYIGGGMGTHSMFSTGGSVLSHADGGFVVGANVTNHNGAVVVGATGDYTNTAHATHNYGSSYANGGLSMSSSFNHAGVNFDGGMITSGSGNGTGNVTAGLDANAISHSGVHNVSATAEMDTSGSAVSLGNVHSYTTSGGIISAFAWH